MGRKHKQFLLQHYRREALENISKKNIARVGEKRQQFENATLQEEGESRKHFKTQEYRRGKKHTTFINITLLGEEEINIIYKQNITGRGK